MIDLMIDWALPSCPITPRNCTVELLSATRMVQNRRAYLISASLGDRTAHGQGLRNPKQLTIRVQFWRWWSLLLSAFSFLAMVFASIAHWQHLSGTVLGIRHGRFASESFFVCRNLCSCIRSKTHNHCSRFTASSRRLGSTLYWLCGSSLGPPQTYRHPTSKVCLPIRKRVAK
ncbi:hypothetical protein F5148DRAFT_1214812 [Russula earlei]|uniref:Uncharacterized protein n=1 Tax=Russula earlei TaxID=71964 RepID=A0ACC0U459_9AGAM|nr:hypothetical protein F5148DRAFT_1214812 [Russula earlei]